MPAVWLKEVKKNHPCDTFSSAVRKPREPTVTSNEPKEARGIRVVLFGAPILAPFSDLKASIYPAAPHSESLANRHAIAVVGLLIRSTYDDRGLTGQSTGMSPVNIIAPTAEYRGPLTSIRIL